MGCVWLLDEGVKWTGSTLSLSVRALCGGEGKEVSTLNTNTHTTS